MAIKRDAYRFKDGVTGLSADTFNQIFYDLDARLHSLELLGVTWKDAVAELQQYGLARINGALAPVLEDLVNRVDVLKSEHTSFVEWWASVKENVQDIHAASVAMQSALVEITAKVDGFEAALQAGLAAKANQDWVDARLDEIKTDLLARATIAEPGATGRPYNGDFQVAQEGAAHSTIGYGSIDGMYNNRVGSNMEIRQMSFPLGQTEVPGEQTHYMRCTVSSVVGAGNYAIVEHRIPDVRNHAGGQVVMALDAKADGTRQIALSLRQYFGTGGSPSLPVDIPAQKVVLGSNWSGGWIARSFDIPSVAGKALGTNGDHYLAMRIIFDAGSNLDSIADNLGQRSGVFDISKWRLVRHVWQLDHNRQSLSDALDDCYQHFQIITATGVANGFSYMAGAFSPVRGFSFTFKRRMRAIPVATYTGYNTFGCVLGSVICTNQQGVVNVDLTAPGNYVIIGGTIRLDARI